MVLTHHITDYTRALVITTVWTITAIVHGIYHATMYWLHTISHIWKSTLHNYRKCVSQIGFTHFFLQISALRDDLPLKPKSSPLSGVNSSAIFCPFNTICQVYASIKRASRALPLNKQSTWLYIVTHKHGESFISLSCIFNMNLFQNTMMRIHSCFPQLLIRHLTQTLERWIPSPLGS